MTISNDFTSPTWLESLREISNASGRRRLQAQTIRSHIRSLESEIARLNQLNDHQSTVIGSQKAAIERVFEFRTDIGDLAIKAGWDAENSSETAIEYLKGAINEAR